MLTHLDSNTIFPKLKDRQYPKMCQLYLLAGVLLLVCSAHAASVPAAEAEGEERFLGGLMMLPAYMLHDQVTQHSEP